MSGKALKLIQPVSKRDQVVTSFKEAILSGIIQPGESIVESRVAQQLGAGIPLVREALIELEHQGYVQKVPYKGTTITKLERRDVEKIFRLRRELESLAIEWAKENVTPADIEESATYHGKDDGGCAGARPRSVLSKRSGLPSQALGDVGQRVSGRFSGAHRGASLRLLFDEGPTPARVVPVQRCPTRKDRSSVAHG